MELSAIRALHGGAKRSEFFRKNKSRSQGVMCKVVGGRYIQRAANKFRPEARAGTELVSINWAAIRTLVPGEDFPPSRSVNRAPWPRCARPRLRDHSAGRLARQRRMTQLLDSLLAIHGIGIR